MTDINPKIFGLYTNAIIGSNKIIFCGALSSSFNCHYDFAVFRYDQPFTVKSYKKYEKNDDQSKWFDNYTFTYTNDFSISVEQVKNKKSKTICYNSDPDINGDFQFGDRERIKTVLSNGDILFNNLGDVTSSVLFCKKTPFYYIL